MASNFPHHLHSRSKKSVRSAARPATCVTANEGGWIGSRCFPSAGDESRIQNFPEERKEALEKALGMHLKANPQPELVRQDGTPITEGMLATDLLVPAVPWSSKSTPMQKVSRTDV